MGNIVYNWKLRVNNLRNIDINNLGIFGRWDEFVIKCNDFKLFEYFLVVI